MNDLQSAMTVEEKKAASVEQGVDILGFQGEHRWLSNFWPAKVILDAAFFPSIEHAFQAAKTHPSLRGPFMRCTAGEAKRLGRTVKMRADWEQVKVPIMRALIIQKFAPGTELGEKLKATGDGKIVEVNHWGDKFWGVCQGRGQNLLGQLLMERRTFLQAPEQKDSELGAAFQRADKGLGHEVAERRETPSSPASSLDDQDVDYGMEQRYEGGY